MAEPKKNNEAPVTTPAEPEYSIWELAAAAPSIAKGANADTMTAALRQAGITKASKSKAEELVTKFIKREVK